MFDPPVRSMKAAVSKGVFSTAGAQGFKLALQVLSVVALARLLSPQDFGVVAMSGAVVAFLALFQNLGLGQATVQRPNLRHQDVNFLFWINMMATSVMAAILMAISPLVANFYNEPRVGPLVAAMSLPIFFNGLGAQHSALLNRRMEFGKLALIEVAGGTVTLLAAVIWATFHPSYWALWGSNLVGSVVVAGLSWAASPWRPSRPKKLDDVAAGSLIGFGAGITGFNFANFFARNLDQILIGRYWGGVELGLYDRAYKLLLFPLSQITNPLSKVMVPALSRMADDDVRYRMAYVRVVRILLLCVLPGVAWGVGMSDRLVVFLLGQNFAESAQIFAALGFAGMLQPINNPTGWLFISQGRGRDFMIWGFITALFAVVAFGIGLKWGAFGMAAAYAVQEYLKTPLLWWFIGKAGPVGTKDLFSSSIPFLIASHCSLYVVWKASAILPGGWEGLVMGLLISFAVALPIAVLFSHGRAAVKEAFTFLVGRQ